MNTTVPYKTEKKVVLNTSWLNTSTDDKYWAADDTYVAVFDVAKTAFAPHRGEAVNSTNHYRRNNYPREEDQKYNLPFETIKKGCLYTFYTADADADSIKEYFEMHVSNLIAFFNYEDLYTDGFIHSLKIKPEYDYHGSDVTITFTITDKVYECIYRGRITDKAEALQFLKEHESESYHYYDGVRGYYSSCAYLPMYVKPEQIVNPDWSDGECDYLFESPLVAAIDISVLADEEVRNILIANQEWPLDNVDYENPMPFDKYAERRKKMDAGELIFEGTDYYMDESEKPEPTDWHAIFNSPRSIVHRLTDGARHNSKKSYGNDPRIYTIATTVNYIKNYAKEEGLTTKLDIEAAEIAADYSYMHCTPVEKLPENILNDPNVQIVGVDHNRECNLITIEYSFSKISDDIARTIFKPWWMD